MRFHLKLHKEEVNLASYLNCDICKAPHEPTSYAMLVNLYFKILEILFVAHFMDIFRDNTHRHLMHFNSAELALPVYLRMYMPKPTPFPSIDTTHITYYILLD